MLAMLFVVSIKREDEPAVVGYVPHETCAASVKIVIAIGLAKSVLLTVIVIEVVAEGADCAVHFRVIAIIPIAAKHVPGREMKRRVHARHFHDEIDGPTGLRTELQRRTGANDFNAFHCVQDWRVMALRKTKLLVLD